MTVWSFCPTEIKKCLETVSLKNKGTSDDIILYRKLWVNWISNFSGCESKKEWAITNGIHDALINQVAHVHTLYDQFYWFDTDYKFYYSILQPYKNYCISSADISSIKPNSYVLVSQPNHEGGITDWFEKLKEHCKNTNSKIFLDCAFYGTTLDILDTSDDVFDSVAFSLSKNFLLGGFRSGIIFSDSLPQTLTLPIGVHFSYNYFNTTAVEVAKVILPNFDATYITKHAKPIQVDYCKKNGLRPADIWMWAFDKSEKVCITEYIMHDVQHQLDISAKTT
jgi:hypothetical protein